MKMKNGKKWLEKQNLLKHLFFGTITQTKFFEYDFTK